MARRTQVTATFFDAEGYPLVAFRGNPQDVGDAAAIYICNIAQPLGGNPLIHLVETREEEET